MSTDCYRICILPTFYFILYFIILRENNTKQNILICKNIIHYFQLIILFKCIISSLILVPVNKINIIRKECVVHIKYGNVKYPVFMRRMNKQIMKVLELTNEPIIYSIKIDECIG